MQFRLLNGIDSSERTFGEEIGRSFDQKMLNITIEELNLSVRACNALKKIGFKTVEDILNCRLQSLMRIRNVGRKTIDDIKKTILALTDESLKETISFVDSIENILSSITPRYLPIIKARYEAGKRKTLEEIGNKIGITKERVRQIIVKELRRVKQQKKRKIFQPLIENLEKLLFVHKGVVSINDMVRDKYFASGTPKQIRFLMNLIVDLYEEQYRIIQKHFLTNLGNDEIEKLQYEIQEAALGCRFPIEEKAFIKSVLSSIGQISEDYLSYQLMYKEHIEISHGKVVSLGRLSIPQRIEFLMKDTNRPMHYTEVVDLYRKHFGDKKGYSDLEHAIHSCIGRSKVVRIAPGTYILRNKFKIPDNIHAIVEMSKEILRGLGGISDTSYLINELRRRNVDIGDINKYSLKSLLLEYPDFIRYLKFEIGIGEHTEKTGRKFHGDLIYEILVSARKELHTKEIWKRLSKQRGLPLYAVAQKLHDEQRFIKIAPATYTVKENIFSFEEKSKKIVGFANEWIQLKKRPIPVFLIMEVLKETDEVEDFPLGLIEYVLSTSHKRIKKGFYDLIQMT